LISGSWLSKLPFPFSPKLSFPQNKQKISKLLSLNSFSLLSINYPQPNEPLLGKFWSFPFTNKDINFRVHANGDDGSVRLGTENEKDDE